MDSRNRTEMFTVWYDRYETLLYDMEQAAHKLYQLRYQMSNGGNLSVRVPNEERMIVKKTDVAFDEVCAETLIVTDFEGNVIEGIGKPSKEALLHGAIYKNIPRAGAIMHCHSPYATAWAANHDSLDFSTHHAFLKFHDKVPVFDTHSYAVPKEYFPEITAFLAEHESSNAFLLRAHGQVTLANDMRMATYLAELMEETAQISVLSAAAANCVSL